MCTLCTNPSEIINDKVNEPPYDKKGKGTPVSGSTPSNPPRLIAMWANMYVATPRQIYLPLNVLDFEDKFNIL